MLGAYAFPRFVRGDSLAGASVLPTRALAPGSAATDWLAMVMVFGRHRMVARLPGAVPRDFVDDLVAHICGGVTREFGGALQLQPNDHKSVRFAQFGPPCGGPRAGCRGFQLWRRSGTEASSCW